MVKKVLMTLVGGSLMMLAMGCNEEPPVTASCQPAGSKAIELTYPKGGESFTVGEKVTITYKIDAEIVDGTVPMVSINNGLSWVTIPEGEAVMTETGDKYQCISYDWTIGSESGDVGYQATNQLILKIRHYQELTDPDISTAITVTQ